jgi:hypothetical protein
MKENQQEGQRVFPEDTGRREDYSDRRQKENIWNPKTQNQKRIPQGNRHTDWHILD